MAIHSNSTDCGQDGSELIGQITKDVLGNYYVNTDNGLYLIPEPVAEVLNASADYRNSILNLVNGNFEIQQVSGGSSVLTLTSYDFDSNPTIQSITQQNKAVTSDDTQTLLHQVIVPTDKAMLVKGYVTAHRMGGAHGSDQDCAAFRVEAIVKKVSGSAVIVGQVVTSIGADDAGYDVAVVANLGLVQLKVVGLSDTEINWYWTGENMAAS